MQRPTLGIKQNLHFFIYLFEFMADWSEEDDVYVSMICDDGSGQVRISSTDRLARRWVRGVEGLSLSVLVSRYSPLCCSIA